MDKQDCASFSGREKVRSSCLSPLSCNSPVLLAGGKVPSSSTSKAFYLTSLAIWLDPSIWWKLVFADSTGWGRQHRQQRQHQLDKQYQLSVRLYCIHFRKDIGKSIHLYSVHVAGVQQLDVLNLIKIAFNKNPRLHNATRSIQSMFQDGSADPEPKHLGDLLTTDDARTVLDVETSSNLVWSIAVVHRTFHPEKDGFDGRLRWIENGWQDSVTVFDRLDWNTYLFEMQATVDIDFGVSCIYWTQKAWDCKYVTFFCRKKLIEQCTFEPRMFAF